jgi:flagellar capping protein FliD
MKLSKLILENTILPIHKRVLRAMTVSLGETDDVAEVWTFLTKDLNISDMYLKIELLHLFLNNFNEDGNYEGLTDSDLEDMDNTSNYDNEHLALAEWLNLPPSLIAEQTYNHYGLNVYKDLENDEEYAVGDDSDATRAMEKRFDGWVDEHGLNNIDTWDLEDYLEIDYYVLNDLARNEANREIEDMDNDQIISKAGYDKDDINDEIESIEAKIEEISDQISDLENEMGDLEDDNEEGEYDSDIDDISIKIRELSSELEDLESQLEEKQRELDELLETARDELLEKLEEKYSERIEGEGLDYFIDEMGYDKTEAINHFFHFDQSGFESHLAETEDRGSELSGYDGNENEEEYDGETYYIYRIN